MKRNNKNKQTENNSSNKNRLLVFLSFLVLVPSVLYFRVVNFDFSTLDDTDIIISHYDKIDDLKNIKEAFTHDAFMSDGGQTFYRPVQTITFMLDAQAGGKEPWIYHLSNLLIHILTVIALFFFLNRVGVKKEISFILSLFFSIHPLFTNAVAWIPARGDLLLGLFTILSFISFLEYFKSRKILWFIIHSLVFLLALFSKEPAMVLPLLILIYYYFAEKNKFILKDIIPFIAVWCISITVFYFLRQSVVRVKLTPGSFGIIPFIKNLPVVPITFGKFFFPNNLATLSLYDNLSLIIGIILVTVFIFLTLKFMNGNRIVILWGALWFLAFTVPAMTLRSYIADLGIEYFDYRAYLPVIGILVIMGIIGNRLLEKYSFNAILKISVPVILIYVIIAFIHSNVFADPVSFFTSAVNANSKNALALYSRGHIFAEGGMAAESIIDFDASIKICPTYSAPIFNKAEVYNSMGDHSRAEELYAEALKYDTLYPEYNTVKDDAYISLSAEKIILKKFDEGLLILNKAKNIYPLSFRIFNNLGYIYSAVGKYDSALISFNRAIQLEPGNASYYNNRAKAKYHLKDYDGSLYDFQIALQLDPDSQSGEIYYYRGMSFSKLNRLSEAKENLDKAEKLGYKVKDLNE
jgi:protein O-mannosyl-transferase